MSGLVKVTFLLFFGLVLGFSYNAWPVVSNAPYGVAGASDLQAVDIISYAAGLVVGMVLWQIGSVPWSAVPARLRAYLASQLHFCQFVMMGAACIAVLVYF